MFNVRLCRRDALRSALLGGFLFASKTALPRAAMPKTVDSLVGRAGGRMRVQTPAALLDLDVFDQSLIRMQDAVRAQGLALRPHVKAHKCSLLAKRQLAAGAIGVCCATLGEAEAMQAGRVCGVLITSPMPTPEKLVRVRALHEQSSDLAFVVDSIEGIEAARAAFSNARVPANVLIDIDAGDQRTGMCELPMVEEALRRIHAAGVLRFRGFQAYSGASQHARTREARRQILESGVALLRASITVANGRGMDAVIVSGGGTGTFDVLGSVGLYTELQAGSYIAMDAEYNDIWLKAGEQPPFDTALFIQVTVISANHAGFVTTDGGKKRFATDAGPPVVVRGAPSAIRYEVWGDEHGKMFVTSGQPQPPIGTRVECWAPHCDPTINLYDTLIGVRQDRVTELLTVDGRAV
jgi:D-serine deaminase-like pyridoxal phosphate-dependent protein